MQSLKIDIYAIQIDNHRTTGTASSGLIPSNADEHGRNTPDACLYQAMSSNSIPNPPKYDPNRYRSDLSLEGKPPCREVDVLLVLLDGDGGLLLGG